MPAGRRAHRLAATAVTARQRGRIGRPPPGGRAGVAGRSGSGGAEPVRHPGKPMRNEPKLPASQDRTIFRLSNRPALSCCLTRSTSVESESASAAAFFDPDKTIISQPSRARVRWHSAQPAHVSRRINRDHELVTPQTSQPAGSVVQRGNGPTRPYTATGYPRATSRGRRAEAGSPAGRGAIEWHSAGQPARQN
jgi:hypothetical protein